MDRAAIILERAWEDMRQLQDLVMQYNQRALSDPPIIIYDSDSDAESDKENISPDSGYGSG